VPVYWAGLVVKDGLRGLGVLRMRRLGWPVVSVGSLSAGGAGKTPVVMKLARLLHDRGWTVDVLSRGYGRGEKGVARVDPRGPTAAKRFGDEPVLIARYARVPVWVGAQRFLAGMAAEAASETQMRCVHLLDDGFQHRKLERCVDVVLVTAEDLADALLPAGNLREGLAALGRADVVVLREEERDRVEPQLSGLLRKDALQWIVRRRHFPVRAGELNAGPGTLAFCAIARPDGFRAMLSEAGYGLVEMIVFADHHAYDMNDIERLVGTAKEFNATGFLTTEKDAVKLSHEMFQRLLSIGPVSLVKLEVNFLEEQRVVRELEARIS
jgi:tetraacyldisaccharide 4'-kinase